MALNALRRFGLGFVSLWFLLGGIGHFVLTDMFVSVTPDWAPFPRAIVLGTGVLEILGTGMLWWAPARRWVGLAMMAFCVAVTPVHVEMLMQAEQYAALGPGVLWGRLLFQPVLVWIIWAVTWRREARVGS